MPTVVDFMHIKKQFQPSTPSLITPNIPNPLKVTQIVSYMTHITVYIRPQKGNYTFLRHRPSHLQPPHIRNFYCISSIHIEKSSIHGELSV